MRQQIASSLGECVLVEPISGTESTIPLPGQSGVAPLNPDEQRPAVLTVTPVEAARLEIVVRLKASGYTTWAASTVREAMELAERAALDGIVLDLDEQYEAGPQGVAISGFRLLHLLRRLTSGRPVALVVVTGFDYTEVEGAVQASADALVTKPLLLTQLVGRLRAALERVRCRYQQSVPSPQARIAGRMR